LLKLLRFKLET